MTSKAYQFSLAAIYICTAIAIFLIFSQPRPKYEYIRENGHTIQLVEIQGKKYIVQHGGGFFTPTTNYVPYQE